MTGVVPAPGVFRGMPASEYHQVDAVSQTLLKLLRKSPAHLRQHRLFPAPSSPSQRFGTLVHDALCVGAENLQISIRPVGIDRRSKEGKQWYAEAEEKGFPIYGTEEVEACKAICEKIHSDQEIARCLEGDKEVSLFNRLLHPDSRGDIQEVFCKARLDLIPKGDFLMDFKTCQDATPDKFAWSVWTYGYAVQAHHYLTLFNSLSEEPRHKFMFVAVECEPPYEFRKYVLSDKYLDIGRREWGDLMSIYTQCIKTNEWPGYPRGIGVLDPPRFSQDRYLAEML
jgi:PDDEXK-like domain of unknown function (DUF3799)